MTMTIGILTENVGVVGRFLACQLGIEYINTQPLINARPFKVAIAGSSHV
ncbi:Uncharacterised protein [BD1-7 clade bacterium]|uniref:Uncharacterized protein n=1 Tax=BD1-7 clade bacterium TaxID=2029982 RepID=A0A5S9PIJ2_9GAMM|nr:Uncharacterised protein [BD1-7 clade bacterium]